MENLNALLSHLSTDEAKVYMIDNLVGKTEISDELIDFAIGFYENKGHLGFGHAAVLANNAGRSEEAQGLYAKFLDDMVPTEHFRLIEDYASKLGIDFDEADLALKSYEKFKSGKDFLRAAQCASKAGLHIEACEMYEEQAKKGGAGWLRHAIYDAKSANDFPRAILYHIKSGELPGGIDLAREKNLLNVALEALEESGRYIDAAKIAKELGLDKKEKEMYKKANKKNKTTDPDNLNVLRLSGFADTAQKAGDEKRAAELYIEAIKHEEKQMLEGIDGHKSLEKLIKVAKSAGLEEKAEAYQTLANLISS